MKIAIDVSQMCYSGTGVGRYVTELTRALLLSNSPHQFILYAGALRQRGFFSSLKRQSPWGRANWKIFPLPPKLAGYAFTDTSIPFELLVGKVDIVHASDWAQPTARAPIVTTVHDLVFRRYPETVDPLILSRQTRRLAKLAESTAGIIVDSISTKQDLLHYYSIDPSRISVVYPGIEPRFSPQKKSEVDRVKKKYKLPDQFILSLGTQEPRKNLTRLAEAVLPLDLPLVLVGRHGWGDHTQTLGFVPDADLPALYSASTVFAYPSLYEGFGFPVLEAMASGAPVVTSDISSLPEVAGSAAVLVDPMDTKSIQNGILLAVKNSEKLIKAGLLQAKKFTWEATARQTLEVYEKIAHRD